MLQSRIKLLFLLISVLTLTACSFYGNKTERLADVNGLSIINAPSDVQTSYIKSKKSYARFCTETDVDFSKTQASGFSIGFGGAGSSESIGDESSQGALSLGGRDPAVLIARELMFRACEFILNVNADERLALKVYAGTLNAIIKVSRAQRLTGTTSVNASQKIDMSQLNNTPKKAAADNSSEKKSKQPVGKQADSSDDFDWNFNWDYTDDDNSIDPKHP